MKPWYTTRLLDQRQVSRGCGDTIILGRCPICGRNVPRSSATKFGSRCRFEGAKFDLEGNLIFDGLKNVGLDALNFEKTRNRVYGRPS